MSIDIAWDNPEKTIIRYDFHPGWTWPDLVQAMQEDDAMINSVDHPVHLIFNFQQIDKLPPNPIHHLKKLAKTGMQEQLGLVVLVSRSMWIEKVGEIFYQVYGAMSSGMLGVRRAETLDAARALIAREAGNVS